VDVEVHVGESVAAEMRREALECARCICSQIEPGGHAVHGVDHAAELRDEEHVHHACRGKLELQRHALGYGERIDRRNFLVGIDEQPFPIQGHRLNCQRLVGSFDGLCRVELMCADPRHAAEQDDGEGRDRPDHKLDPPRILPVWPVKCFCVGGPKPERKGKDRGDGRQHDRQHDPKRVDQDGLFGGPDRPLWIKDIHRPNLKL
jgi:hypothetical protein